MRGLGNRGSPPASLSSSPGRRRRIIVKGLLGRGVHASPHDGCNVLGYASVLAGERWTSCPQSVHPALADVAFLVNDQMTDDGRRLPTPLAPWLLGTKTAAPQTWPATTEVCVRAALTWVGQPDEPRLQVDLDATRNWLAEASRPANRRCVPRAERRQRRWAWHAIRSALLTVVASGDQPGNADARLRLDGAGLSAGPYPYLLPGWPDAAQAQPTHGKTEPATTHLFWSANGMRNSKLGEEVTVPC
jgi:hypothetical protein